MATEAPPTPTIHDLVRKLVDEEVEKALEWGKQWEIQNENRPPWSAYVIAGLVYMYDSLMQRPMEMGTILCQAAGPYNHDEASRLFDEYDFTRELIYKVVKMWTHHPSVPCVFDIACMNMKYMISNLAATYNDLDTLKWLLNQGDVMVDNRDIFRCTPLHLAAEKGHIRIAQELVERGASFYVLDEKRETPLEKALNGEFFEMAELLKPDVLCNHIYDDGETLLFKLIRSEMETQVEYLVKYANFSILNQSGQNVYHVAAETGNPNITQTLISANSCSQFVNATDLFGRSPLHIGVLGNHALVVHVLLQNGAYYTHSIIDQVMRNNNEDLFRVVKFFTRDEFRRRYAFRALQRLSTQSSDLFP